MCVGGGFILNMLCSKQTEASGPTSLAWDEDLCFEGKGGVSQLK